MCYCLNRCTSSGASSSAWVTVALCAARVAKYFYFGHSSRWRFQAFHGQDWGLVIRCSWETQRMQLSMPLIMSTISSRDLVMLWIITTQRIRRIGLAGVTQRRTPAARVGRIAFVRTQPCPAAFYRLEAHLLILDMTVDICVRPGIARHRLPITMRRFL